MPLSHRAGSNREQNPKGGNCFPHHTLAERNKGAYLEWALPPAPWQTGRVLGDQAPSLRHFRVELCPISPHILHFTEQQPSFLPATPPSAISLSPALNFYTTPLKSLLQPDEHRHRPQTAAHVPVLKAKKKRPKERERESPPAPPPPPASQWVCRLASNSNRKLPGGAGREEGETDCLSCLWHSLECAKST